jgi:hypothetical protein
MSHAQHHTISPITPVNPMSILEHGNSPTAIILAIAILLRILLGSLTRIVQIILILILREITRR